VKIRRRYKLDLGNHLIF